MPEETPKLNILAEFADPTLERAFFRSYIFSVRLYIAYACLLTGIVYLALGFFDIFALGRYDTAAMNLCLRSSIFLFAAGVAVMFLGFTAWYMVEVPAYQTLGVSIYFLFVIVLGAMFSRSLQVQRRMHFFRERQLERLSNTDRLTGIYNRQKFDEVFSAWLARAGGEPGGFSVIMFDLDDFKKLNDSYGHMAGDEMLVASVEAVRGAIRSRDIFARWGGEEFMILLPGTPLDAAVSLAERLRALIEQLSFPLGGQVTASFGVTPYCPGDSSDTIITRVDGLMYRAKTEGKNRVCTDRDEPAAPPAMAVDEGQITLFPEEGRRA